MLKREDWQKIAPEFRLRWQERLPDHTERWEDHEPWYRYGYEHGFDPQFEDLEWCDVEADLRMKYPEWAERQGYAHDGDDRWQRFKDSVRDAWETVTGRR
jgi:hypothetical protein